MNQQVVHIYFPQCFKLLLDLLQDVRLFLKKLLESFRILCVNRDNTPFGFTPPMFMLNITIIEI